MATLLWFRQSDSQISKGNAISGHSGIATTSVPWLAPAWNYSTVLPEMSKAHTPYKTASDVLLRVRVATHQLSAARKQAIAAYDEDLRALKNLDLKLATVETLQQPELFDIDSSLTPELIRLLDSPLAKYQ
jgi:hypothetical protein